MLQFGTMFIHMANVENQSKYNIQEEEINDLDICIQEGDFTFHEIV